jgi:hypothetical protein
MSNKLGINVNIHQFGDVELYDVGTMLIEEKMYNVQPLDPIILIFDASRINFGSNNINI